MKSVSDTFDKKHYAFQVLNCDRLVRDILDFSGTGKDGENTYGHDFNVNAGVMTRDTWQFFKQYNNGGMG